MIWLAAGLAAFAAVVVWHMRHPRYREVEISAAPFLGTLPPPRRASLRLALTAPLGSLRFWLRAGMAALALAVLALFGEGGTMAASGERIGLRLVIDRTGSMAVTGADGRSRMAEGRDEALAALTAAREAAGAAPFCATLIGAGATVEAPVAATPEAIEGLLPVAGGGAAAILAEAAQVPAADCPTTHVVIVTDRRPAGDPALIWRQVGTAADNAGIASAVQVPDGASARLMVGVARFGAATETALDVSAPDGTVTRHAVAGGSVAVPVGPPGRYALSLTAGGAYPGDDLAVIEVPDLAPGRVDWRLGWPSPPRGMVRASGPGVPVVAVLDALTPEELAGPVVAVAGGWGGTARIGLFDGASPLLDDINFDALEATPPTGLPKLPEGFAPVLTAEDGTVWIATRADPPGVILPVPDRVEGSALSATLLYNALKTVGTRAARTLDVVWLDGSGQVVPEAGAESDTAEPVGASDPLVFRAAVAPGREAPPLWPWLVLGSLALLAVERLLGPAQRKAAA